MVLPDGESHFLAAFRRAAALDGISEVRTVTGRAVLKTEDGNRRVAGGGIAQRFILYSFGRKPLQL